ncbi:DUF5324 family protein [Streptomyces bobili]|uniref:DUF5324 family protein n=1 Tax=Streptomyces bobili TaxID=67280 RepID=UPI00372382FC
MANASSRRRRRRRRRRSGTWTLIHQDPLFALLLLAGLCTAGAIAVREWQERKNPDWLVEPPSQADDFDQAATARGVEEEW